MSMKRTATATWTSVACLTESGPRRAQLARELTQVVSEPIFDIPWLMKAARHQGFDPILSGGSPERGNARIPPGPQLDVRRQAGVHEALGISNRPFVEPGDPGCERL